MKSCKCGGNIVGDGSYMKCIICGQEPESQELAVTRDVTVLEEGNETSDLMRSAQTKKIYRKFLRDLEQGRKRA